MWGAVGGSGVRTDDETLPERLRMGTESGDVSDSRELLRCGLTRLLTVSFLFAPFEPTLPPRSPFKLLLRVSEWDRSCVFKLN